MIPFRSKSKPQKRFYIVVGLLAFTLFTGSATGFELFYRLVYVLGLTTVIAYAWTWYSVHSIDVTVRRRTHQSQVGDFIQQEITVVNNDRLPKWSIEVTDMTDLPGNHPGQAMNLNGNDSSSWTWRTVARKRGLYNLGLINVATTDPFGMFRREKVFDHTTEVLVFPRTFDMPSFDVPAADLSGESSIRKRTHNVTPHASSIREYEFGDSLSRVHWNSTARLGKLMSKVFDLGRAAEVWLLIDLHRDVQAGMLEESTDEYAVSIGGSLAKRYIGDELPVGLSSYGDQHYLLTADTGTGHLQRIMEYLAMSKSEGLIPIQDALVRDEHFWGHQSSLIVITSSPSQDWVLALGELSKRGVKVVVVLLDSASFGGFLDSTEALDSLHSAGIHTYLVRKGDDLQASLNRVYTVDHVPKAHSVLEEFAGV